MKRIWKHFQFVCTMLVIAGSIIVGLSIRTKAATPGIINYQGRVLVGSAPFNGPGNFKFALVDSDGITAATTFWTNDNSGVGPGSTEPGTPVPLTVANGLYSVVLGDTTVTGINNAIPASVFSNSNVRLRIWFNDMTNGSKLLVPDQRVAATGYALQAAVVDDLSVTTAKLADSAVTSAKVSAFPKCSVTHSTTQTVAVGTNGLISFDTVRYDNDNIHNAGNVSRHTVNTAGVYLLTFTFYLDCGPTGFVYGTINVNGTTVALSQTVPSSGGSAGSSLSAQVQMNAGDFVECTITNGTGGICTIFNGSYTPQLQMTKLP